MENTFFQEFVFEIINIRNSIIQKRLYLSLAEREKFSAAIEKKLLSLDIFQQSQHIACYLEHKNEVATAEIINEIWRLNKNCYLPIISSDQTLKFVEYTTHTELTPNKFGILEPDLYNATSRDAQELDLVLTPLVAFNNNCFRAGWGLGHYDRTFVFLLKETRPSKPFLLGLAYHFQLCEDIKIHEWDVPLDMVITEEKIFM